MTVMVSFRADEADVARVDRWAARMGIERSELLREALAAHLVRLEAEDDVVAYTSDPFTADEEGLDAADDWGPSEDWSDWAEWADRRDDATR